MSAVEEDMQDIIMSTAETLRTYRIGVDLEPCTHLILGQAARTLKVLFALARGTWVVSPEWLIRGFVEQGEPIDEAPFEHKSFCGGAKARKCRLQKEGLLLSGRRVFVLADSRADPPTKIVRDLLVECGAQVVHSIAAADIAIKVTPKPTSGDTSSKSKSTPVVSHKWLFDSLMTYTLADLTHYTLVQGY
jgi:hypothetical protein